MDEGGVGASAAGGLEHVEGADGISFEIVEGDRRCPVMAGLGRGMDDGVGLDLGHQVEDSLTVANVEFVVNEALELILQTLLVPAGVSLWSEEDSTLVVINALDLVA